VSLGWQQLHTLIGIAPTEDREDVYTGIGSLNEAGPDEVSFLSNTRYQPQLAETKAGAVLVSVGEFTAPGDCRLIPVANFFQVD
jgi:UDP-3-O-[3-hydroxymyristoyl] glucosamine N-acyltransferase